MPSWTQPEFVDLNVLMRDVNDYSREWVDKYVNELRKLKVTFTYEKMKNEESSLNDDERTISNVRTHNDDESQAPKRRKAMPRGSQMKGKEIVSQESRHKKHKSNTLQSIMSSSSVKENDMTERDNESERGSNTEILSENDQGLHATAQSAPHDDDDEQPISPTIQLEVDLGNNVVDLTKDKDIDDDAIRALRGLDQDLNLEEGM